MVAGPEHKSQERGLALALLPCVAGHSLAELGSVGSGVIGVQLPVKNWGAVL